MQKELSYEQRKSNILQKYRTVVVPILKKYKNKQLEANVKGKCVVGIAVMIGILSDISITVLSATNEGFNASLGWLTLFAFFIGLCIKGNYLKKLEVEIKTEVMPVFCSCFSNLKWDYGKYPEEQILKRVGFIENYERASFDDIFFGEYNGIGYHIIEGGFSKRSDKKKRSDAMFSGLIIRIDFNKKIKGKTVILQKPLLEMGFLPSCCYRTQMEDVEFEKQFVVYTNDEVEARYLVTPSFMERLSNIKFAFKTIKTNCSFEGNHLFIGLISSGDRFSISDLTKNLEDESMFIQVFDEIISIEQLIDHFKLDQKLGL